MTSNSGVIPKKPVQSSSSSPTINNNQSKKSKDIQRTIRTIRMGYKVLIIMRGVPGSGKSYLSRHILEQTVGLHTGQPHILSTDDYFMINGKYVHNPNMLQEAHGWNHNRAFNSMRIGVSPVIIDNTNTEMWEMRPYATMACDYGYLIEILEPDTHWCFNEKELVRRTVHSVPKLKIREMIERYQKNITPVKLLHTFNITYKSNRKPPQLRSIPPVNKQITNSVSLNDTQMRNIQKCNFNSENNSPQHQIFTNLQCESTTKPSEIINLMDFDDDVNAWNSKSVDDILTVKQTDVLQPNTSQSKVTSSNTKWKWESASMFDHLENNWGTSEAAMRSWNIVAPIDCNLSSENDQQNVITSSTNHIPYKLVDNSCNTDQSEFALIKNETYLAGCKILTTYNRNINLNTPAERRNIIPKKIVIDKSCSTDDLLNDTQSNLATLMNMFPHIEIKIIQYWYDKCKGDLDWTIELLLQEEPEAVSLLANDEMDNETTENEMPMAKEAETNKCTSKRKINRSDEEAEKLKRCIEEKVNIGNEFYSNHLLKVKNRYNSVEPDVVETMDSDEDFNNESEEDEEMDETIEVNLGNSFVTQLETTFGDNSLVYPRGLQPVVQMPMNLARQIYMLYMESVFQQLDNQNQVLETLVKEDEEFARKLACEEDEKNRKQSTSKTPNLEEIMADEKNYKRIIDDYRKLTPETFAARLTKQKLFESFPNVNREAILEIWHANNCNYQETVDTILESVGPEEMHGKMEDVREPPLNETIINDLKQEHNDCLTNNEEQHDAMYYREAANSYIQKRNELYQKARQYYQRGMTEVAQYYTSLAAQQTNLYDRANNIAAQTFLEEHAKRLQNFNTLDLHYLYVKEAIPALDLFIDRNINLLKGSKSKQSDYLHVITGRGKRSEGGVSRIKPAIIKHLRKRDIK